MKKLLLLLLCLPLMTLAQQPTYVPDDNFEAYLEANGMGNGIANDDYVTTANINTITTLNVSNGAGSGASIFDLTGIEDFTALGVLFCEDNQLVTLDVSANSSLTNLYCGSNQLTSLDVSNNTVLTWLDCEYNQLTSLNISTSVRWLYCSDNKLFTVDLSFNIDLMEVHCFGNNLTALNLSQNINLEGLWCYDNELISLDLSNNPLLNRMFFHYNQLTTLDIRNGNNQNIGNFNVNNNPNLYCIDVDDTTWSNANWTVTNGSIDSQQYFSNNCSGTAIEEHTTNKELLRTIDILGRKTKGTKSEPLFYLYDDGTVEKKVIIE